LKCRKFLRQNCDMKVSECIVRGQNAWLVSYKKDGAYRRKYFKTRKDAAAWAKDWGDAETTEQKEALLFTDSQLQDIREALLILPKGKTLKACVKEACAYTSDVALADIKNDFLQIKKPRITSDEYAHIKGRVEDFCKTFLRFEDCSPKKLLTYLNAKGTPKTVANWKGSIGGFLDYASRKGVISASPLRSLHEDDFALVKRTPPSFLSIRQAKTFLARLKEKYPQYIKYYALGMFAGMRAEEIKKFKEEFIRYEEQKILIPAEIDKNNKARVLEDLPPALWAWLNAFKDHPIKRPSNTLRSDGFKDLKLPHNFARHSFATYHGSLHIDKGVGYTTRITRHSEQTFKDHYFGALVARDVAQAYFDILP